jgi:hypothetical protein
VVTEGLTGNEELAMADPFLDDKITGIETPEKKNLIIMNFWICH